MSILGLAIHEAVCVVENKHYKRNENKEKFLLFCIFHFLVLLNLEFCQKKVSHFSTIIVDLREKSSKVHFHHRNCPTGNQVCKICCLNRLCDSVSKYTGCGFIFKFGFRISRDLVYIGTADIR